MAPTLMDSWQAWLVSPSHVLDMPTTKPHILCTNSWWFLLAWMPCQYPCWHRAILCSKFILNCVLKFSFGDSLYDLFNLFNLCFFCTCVFKHIWVLEIIQISFSNIYFLIFTIICFSLFGNSLNEFFILLNYVFYC